MSEQQQRAPGGEDFGHTIGGSMPKRPSGATARNDEQRQRQRVNAEAKKAQP